jgi:hypothetical protein
MFDVGLMELAGAQQRRLLVAPGVEILIVEGALGGHCFFLPFDLLCVYQSPSFPRFKRIDSWKSRPIVNEPSANSANPLLAPWTGPFSAPPFAAIQPEHFRPAFDAALGEKRV